MELGKGLKVPDVWKQLGVSEQTYYRWRTKYGGMAPKMAKQMKVLEKENVRLKRLVASLSLDNQILKEADSLLTHSGKKNPLRKALD